MKTWALKQAKREIAGLKDVRIGGALARHATVESWLKRADHPQSKAKWRRGNMTQDRPRYTLKELLANEPRKRGSEEAQEVNDLCPDPFWEVEIFIVRSWETSWITVQAPTPHVALIKAISGFRPLEEEESFTHISVKAK
jgi:hypothetical protein